MLRPSRRAGDDVQLDLLALVLTSALLHAVWNAGLKGRRDPAAAGLWVVATAAVMSACLAFVLQQRALPAASLPWVLGAGVVEGAYFSSLLLALTHLPLQVAYGVSRGLGVLLAWPLAVLWLGEVVTPLSLAGAIFLSLGLGLGVLEPAVTPQPGQDRRLGIAATGVCALTISLYPLIYQQALRHGAAPFALFAVSLTISLPIQAVWLGRQLRARLLAELRLQPRVLLVCGGLCAASFLALLWALQTGGAAHLSALRNTSVLVATALAARTQPLTRLDWARAVLVTLGAVLVAL